MHMIKVHSNISAAFDDCYSVSGKYSLRFLCLQIIWKCCLEILSIEEWTVTRL